MAITTNYSIYYPVGTDSVAPLHTAFGTLASSVDTALTNNFKPLKDYVQNYSYIAATYADRPVTPTPLNGSTMFVTNTKARYYFDGTVWVLLYQPWTTFTPVLTDGTTALTNFTLTDTGRYMVSNNTVYVQIAATLAGAPANFAAMYVNFPVTGATTLNASLPIGDGTYVKSADIYPLKVLHNSSTRGLVRYQTTKLVPVNKTSASAGVPVIQASGDTITFNFSYKLTT
jgi:hypothetical protein